MICYAYNAKTGRVRYWHEAAAPNAGEESAEALPAKPEAEAGKAPHLYRAANGTLEWHQDVIPPAPEPPSGPTREEARQARQEAYRERVDPLTAEISRLRDMAPDDPRIAEAEAEREVAVAEIVAANPYPGGGGLTQ